MLRFLSRSEVDAVAWDACVAVSSQRIVYGYSWYLAAVLLRPDWNGRDARTGGPAFRWVGLVLPDDTGGYRAVMPVPLRQKFGTWVVHQPLFCQMLGVFSRDPALDPTPFYQAVYERFRYGSVIHFNQYPSPVVPFDIVRQLTTHTLNLSIGYEAIYEHYTPDRRRNLRVAQAARWTVVDSTDPEPLLRLFGGNHAGQIDGGVGAWAYVILRDLYNALKTRNLIVLRYAVLNGKTEAGALFVREGNRIIYLFNAASEAGRRGNARTLLIDQIIREQAGRGDADLPMLLDFESPEKESVRAFYESFGGVTEPFWSARWNRLTMIERAGVWLLQRLG